MRSGMRAVRVLLTLISGIFGVCASGWAAQPGSALEREGRTVAVEPYGPNIVRITLSADRARALDGPGYGFEASPTASGWSRESGPDGDTFRSARLVVRVGPQNLRPSHLMPLDKVNSDLRKIYFYGDWSRGRYDDQITIETADGKPLLSMSRWSMVPADNGRDGFTVSADFASPADEHYYGLGQQQQGALDLRDHHISCWHDYGAVGGENVCVPFLVSSRGYGLVWDNPSKTTVDLGFNQRNLWSSEVGDRVSFFVIAGATTDEIYQGYRQLTGVAHLLPKAAFGYIQSKAIYPTQEQLLDVAKGYRDRKLPLDILVVDFLNMTRQGEMDLDPARWPNALQMNRQLHGMGIETLLSVWPHFSAGTRFYDMLKEKGWLIRKADGTPDVGNYTKEIGPNIDTTSPEAAQWWWAQIRDRYLKPYDFDYVWLDETEPDIDPENDTLSAGSGAAFYNIYPLVHTASVYEGFRRDYGDARRVCILARAAYLGAQRNGTVFWSSDVVSTWDMLKRSIPAGLNFTASGMPYWDTDIGGFFSPRIEPGYHAQHKPLIAAGSASSMIDGYEDYPELFVRWFEWGAFQPVMRAHGEREHNEVWSYGAEAEPILSKYLRFRYQLLPYIYSIAYGSYQTGAPFMRALFMDFGGDPKVADIRDEYMFGPAFLVAPVTDQGATSRGVYLPAGSAWYNYWTNERFEGGQTVEAAAPIDTLPLFVRAGSIVPLGSAIMNTHERQAIEQLRVYPGKDADFPLFSDDGVSYAYEKGAGSVVHLRWDEAAHRLDHKGIDAKAVEIVHP